MSGHRLKILLAAALLGGCVAACNSMDQGGAPNANAAGSNSSATTGDTSGAGSASGTTNSTAVNPGSNSTSTGTTTNGPR